jgi:hypothetical protein
MDSLPSHDPLPSLHPATAVERELQSIRLALQISLAALVILAGSLGIYMFRQVSLLRRQTENATRQAQHLVNLFNTTVGPQAQAFEKRLHDYAQGDPEFQTRLSKYYPPRAGQSPSDPQTGAAPGAAPTPEPAPTPAPAP